MPLREDGVRELICALARDLDAAPRGARGALIKRAVAFTGFSMPTLYRHLQKQAGWTSGRTTRADKGDSSQSEDALILATALQRESVRQNGKVTMHMPTAASIAAVNGADIAVSADRLQRMARARRLDVARQKEERPYQEMRALHPNHVHQVDPSLCLLYYLPNGTQRLIREDEWYKNKPAGADKIKLKVWRYVLWDAASSVVCVRYYEGAGESQANLFDFLMYAWGMPADTTVRPFHGVPKVLIWDKGSANSSAAIQSMLDGLEVQAIAHAKGNPRAKGGVEGANNIVETHFECRLKADPVENIDELNAAAEWWMHAFNADRVPHMDSRLRRAGLARPMVRNDLWLKITEQQLRILPPVELCRALLEGKPQPRKVAANLQITFKHPQADRSWQYDVSGLDGVCTGDTVLVSPLVYGQCEIVIRVERYDGAPLTYRLTPLTAFDEFGQPLTAAIWGEEFKSKPDTAAETAGKQMDRLAYPDRLLEDVAKARDKGETPFGGLDAHRHLKHVDIPTHLPKRGFSINVPDAAEVQIKPLTHAQAAIKLQAMVGELWTKETYAQITKTYPDGVPEAALQGIAEGLARPSPTQAATGTDSYRFQVVK